MTIKEYPDGSKFTATHMGVALGLGAIGAAALFTISEKVSDFRMRKYYPKRNKTTKES